MDSMVCQYVLAIASMVFHYPKVNCEPRSREIFITEKKAFLQFAVIAVSVFGFWQRKVFKINLNKNRKPE